MTPETRNEGLPLCMYAGLRRWSCPPGQNPGQNPGQFLGQFLGQHTYDTQIDTQNNTRTHTPQTRHLLIPFCNTTAGSLGSLGSHHSSISSKPDGHPPKVLRDSLRVPSAPTSQHSEAAPPSLRSGPRRPPTFRSSSASPRPRRASARRRQGLSTARRTPPFFAAGSGRHPRTHACMGSCMGRTGSVVGRHPRDQHDQHGCHRHAPALREPRRGTHTDSGVSGTSGGRPAGLCRTQARTQSVPESEIAPVCS